MLYPCRDATFSAIWGDAEVPKKTYIIVVSILVFSAMLLGLFIPDVSMVLTVLGSVSNPVVRCKVDMFHTSLFVLSEDFPRTLEEARQIDLLWSDGIDDFSRSDGICDVLGGYSWYSNLNNKICRPQGTWKLIHL